MEYHNVRMYDENFMTESSRATQILEDVRRARELEMKKPVPFSKTTTGRQAAQ